MSITHLTSANFDEAISNGTILVDFWAGWCNPCKMVAPIIEELAAENEGLISVGKVDVDDEKSLAVRFEINSIPTIIIFKDGVELKRLIGVQPKAVYRAAIGS